MEELKVFDPNGKWFVNTAQFPVVDYDSGCRFDPHVPTQAPETTWLKDQAAYMLPYTLAVPTVEGEDSQPKAAGKKPK